MGKIMEATKTAKSGAISATILEAIGNTPLLDLGDGIYAKAEFMNPSGSIKARMANYMIERGGRRAAKTRRYDRRSDKRQHRQRAQHDRRGQRL